MTDSSGIPKPAAQDQPEPAFSEMTERPEPVYPRDLSKAMLLAAIFGPLGLFYTAPGAALVLLAAVFVATFINLDNAEAAWLLATGISVAWTYYSVSRHNRKATVRGRKEV